MNDPSRLVESEKEAYDRIIEELVRAVQPFDEIETCHQEDILRWIDTGVPLCRTRKPDTPPKHLVSYFTLYDPKVNQLLLVNHKKALLWLPPGGHVEPNEHPSDTAKRELNEELFKQGSHSTRLFSLGLLPILLVLPLPYPPILSSFF